MKEYSDGWVESYKALDSCNVETLQNPVIKRTMDFSFYDRQVKEILNHLDSEGLRILEIGAGTGGFAKKLLTERFGISDYVIIDHPSMLRFAKENLKKFPQVKYVSVSEIENINAKEFDCFISIHCLTETPIEYQEYVYDKLFPLCKKIIIIDGETNMEFNIRLEEYLNVYFRDITIQAWPDYDESKLFIAGQLKI